MSYPASVPMPYQAPGPVPFPYAGDHQGPRRVLTLNLKQGWGWRRGSVNIGIDGTQYPANWGMVAFEIPADRPVSLTIAEPMISGYGTGFTSMSGWSQGGVATYVVPPGPSLMLEYQAPAYANMAGSIAPPGQTQHYGVGMRWGTTGCALAMLLGTIPLMIFIVWLAWTLMSPY